MSKLVRYVLVGAFLTNCLVSSGTALASPLVGNVKSLNDVAATQRDLRDIHYRGYGVAAGIAAGFVGAAIASNYYYYHRPYYFYYGYPAYYDPYPSDYSYPYRVYRRAYYPYGYYRAYPRYRYYRVHARRHYYRHRHW